MNRVYYFAAALLYILFFFLLFPWYRYVMDVDAVSYIHVADRISRGAYYNSINGCWSPLSSWLLVPFIKTGFDPVISAKYINGFLGLFTLFSCYGLIGKLNIHSTLKKIIPFVFAVLFLSYAFVELFADLLQLFLITLYLNLLLSKDFIRNNYKIIAAGILGGLNYYAKAYNFPFFPVYFAVTIFILLKKNNTPTLSSVFLKKVALGLISFFIITAPYVILLSNKYGSPIISNAGKLNMSWLLDPGASNSRRMVIEPPYTDATSSWDEPTYAQDKFVGPFTSFHYFLKEIKLTCSNAIQFAGMLNDMTIFSFLILIGFIIYARHVKKETTANEWIIFIITLLYPFGYLFIMVQWRYVWIVPITLLLIAAVLLSFLFTEQIISKKILVIFSIVISLSFTYQPMRELEALKDDNKDIYEMAAVFKQHGIKGKFFLNFRSTELSDKTQILCYLIQSKLYGPYTFDYNFEELMQNARKYNIDYYLYYYEFPNEKETFLQSSYAKAGIKVFDNLYPGVILVQLK